MNSSETGKDGINLGGRWHWLVLWLSCWLAWPVGAAELVPGVVAGRLKYEIFSEGKVEREINYEFQATLQGAEFHVLTVSEASRTNHIRAYEAGFDGTNVYKVHRYDTNALLKLPESRRSKVRNDAVAVIEPGLVPNFDMSMATPVWLTWASGPYYAAITNGLARPVWNYDSKALRWLDHKERVEVAFTDESRHFVSKLRYFNDGFYRLDAPGNSIRKVAAPAPFDQGYQIAEFAVVEVQEFAGSKLPKIAMFTKFRPDQGGKTTNDVVVQYRVTLQATNYSQPTGIGSVLPGLETATLITDRRTGNGGETGTIRQIVATNTTWAAVKLPLSQVKPLTEVAGVKKKTPTSGAKSQGRLLLVLLVLLAPLIFGLLVRKARTSP
ncbi:MAG: hypothetical protein ACO1QS_18375 [Verrucomicrobiota bacterium]